MCRYVWIELVDERVVLEEEDTSTLTPQPDNPPFKYECIHAKTRTANPNRAEVEHERVAQQTPNTIVIFASRHESISCHATLAAVPTPLE